MRGEAACSAGGRSRCTLHWSQTPGPYVINPTRRDRVTFGRIFARVERTLSIRLTVPAER